MDKWCKILVNALKILLIVVVISTISACTKNSDSNDENSVVACNNANTGDDSCKEDFDDTNCLGCQIFDTMFNAINSYYNKMQKIFSNGARNFMAVAFALWLALRLLKYVSSVTENNIGEVWNEILRKAFICVLCAIVVSNTTMLNMFINTFIMPIYMAFLELGVAILNTSTDASNGATITIFDEEISTKTGFTCQMPQQDINFSSTGLPKDMGDVMNCMLRYLKDNLSMGGKVGWQAMAKSRGFLSPVIGFVLFACFWIVKICFVFYLVDSVFQMGIIMFMLPIFIMAYAFGPTKKWATSAFNRVIATSSFLMCFSIIVALTVRGMIELIDANKAIFNPGESAKEDLSIGFMCLVLIGFLISGSMGVANAVSGALVGGKAATNFQKKLKGVVQGAAGVAWKSITGLITFGVAAFPNSFISRASNTIKRIESKINKVQRAAGRRE